MLKYLAFYALGIGVAIVSPLGATKETLLLIEAVTLSALIASFLVPFAAFAENEKWQRFALQYAAVPLFGVWTVLAWANSSKLGLFVLVCASAVHFGFWMSGIHSRAYRFEQFRTGFAREMPHTTRLIAMLNGNGWAHLADILIKAVLESTEIDFKVFRSFLEGRGNVDRVLTAVSGEVTHERNRWLQP